MSPLSQARNHLAESFGHVEYRLGQEEAIAAILHGRDALVVMPTGAGKSLCYQLPALCLPGVTIVVSPLIALMKDQVDDLALKNIPATFINSTISGAEIDRRLADVAAGKVKLLYIAPERFYQRSFVEALRDIQVSLFAVDEAHCISEWGHDFRPSYLKLNEAARQLGRPSDLSFVVRSTEKGALAKGGRPPILALTATATPDVRDDIVQSLDLKDPYVLVTGFDRPNLNYGVFRANPSSKLSRTLELVRQVKGPAIIYAGTRDAVDGVAEVLRANDVAAVAYHAGLPKAERDENQERFMADRARVMVATNAFGLGVDKPNIRLLIHFDMPGTLEAYYQEAGRAGRDGKPTYAVLLYHSSDRYLREFFIEGENPTPEVVRAVWRYLTYQQGDIIYTTYSEILEGIGVKVPELAVGTALNILEHAGCLKRPHAGESETFLKVRVSLLEIETKLNPRAKVQVAVWQHLKARYGSELEEGVYFSPETVVNTSAVTRESLSRSLRALAAISRSGD